MFDFGLLIKLLFSTFSFRKDSLRFPTFKRIFAVIFLFPLFTTIIVVNWVFLLLDEVFFFNYRRQKVSKSLFVIGVPRSATTFMLEILYGDKENFTGFTMWEMILAPSIIQKYFWLAIIAIDRKIGRPLYRLSLWFDRVVFGDFREIHDMGLSKPEEDEVLLIYAFSSVYLSYFYPEVKVMDDYLLFDEGLSERKKRRILAFYKRGVQRHNYVFNRKQEKYFLSKNPGFISKIGSVAEAFPEGKIVYMLRTPLKTIPATISLNNHIYSSFAKVPEEGALVDKTSRFVMEWYRMAEEALSKLEEHQKFVVPFKDFVSDPSTMVKNLYQSAGLKWTSAQQERLEAIQEAKKNYKSGHSYDTSAGVNKEFIESELKKLYSPEMLARI